MLAVVTTIAAAVHHSRRIGSAAAIDSHFLSGASFMLKPSPDVLWPRGKRTNS
jgi:hypothetical protein